MIEAIPDHSKGLTPDVMRVCIIQTANAALVALAGLEEELDDAHKEIDRLTEELIASNKAPLWRP
jgi:hypothetical protein